MPWGDRNILPGAGKARDDSLRADYARLCEIRRSHPALSRGRYAGLVADKDLLVFARRDSLVCDAVVVAVNRGGAEATATIALPVEWAGASGAADLWNRESLALSGDSLTLTLPGLSARVIAAKRTNR